MCTRKTVPRGIFYVARAFSGKTIEPFAPPGRYKRNITTLRLSHTPSNNPTARSVSWLCRNVATQQHRENTQHQQTHGRPLNVLGKLSPSRPSGAHEEGRADVRIRACNRACDHAFTFRALRWSARRGRADGKILLDGDKAHGGRVHPPPMPRRRQ